LTWQSDPQVYFSSAGFYRTPAHATHHDTGIVLAWYRKSKSTAMAVMPLNPPNLPLLKRLDVRKVVVFRALQLGDMLCAVPALRALRAALPHAHITLVGLPWATQFASRFSRYLDDFIVFPGHPSFPEQKVDEGRLHGFYEDVRARKFDLAVQMHGSGEISNGIVGAFGAKAVCGFAGGMQSDAFLPYAISGPEPLNLVRLVRFLGATVAGIELEFPLSASDHGELRDSGLSDRLVGREYICIHPGARFRNKCWAPHRFAQVADRLATEFGLPVVLTGSDKEIDLTSAVAQSMRLPAVNAAAPISIGAMAALMSGARLLVCNDTGVSHIAAGLRLRSVVIFSTADIHRWSPLNRSLHRCIWDPAGKRAATVLQLARGLLWNR
jgi:ADP-heptose:LPS heptosyltransferase